MLNKTNQSLRILVMAILSISLALLAAGCGGGDEPEVTLATSTPKPAEPTSTTVPAPAEDAENAEEHIQAGAAYFADGEYAKAIVEIEEAIKLEPDNADAHTNLALAYFKNGDYESAASAWTDAISFSPDGASAHVERGRSYFNLKKYEQAIADFTQAIDLGSNDAGAYNMRGRSYSFLEDYEQAIVDFTQAIELDPALDDAYFNRAVSTSKIGSTADDLAAIIADYGMVLQISENPDLREPAQKSLETFLENSDDPDLRQQAADALQGKVATPDSPETGEEPSDMDIDINRDPGHSIGFEKRLEPGGSHRFLFLASPGDTVGASISSTSDMLIGIRDANTGEVLGAVPNNDDSLFVTITQNALYHIVVEDASGEGGDYAAAFEASSKVSFALDPDYFIIGRLPEGGLLYYTYSALGGATLRGNVIPHPDTPVDFVVEILDLDSRVKLLRANESGPGENERFTFTVPDSGDGKLMTYIVTVADADRGKGAYILAISSDAADVEAPPLPAESPQSVMYVIFVAAAAGYYDSLCDLCDPLGQNDADTQGICDLTEDESNREESAEYFHTGRISGDVEISPAGDRAKVPFSFGPDGDLEETMELINRGGKWYLFGF